MRRVTIVLIAVTIFAMGAEFRLAAGDPIGTISLIGGGSTDPHATANGAMWLDTGSGPQLIPDRFDDALGLNSDHSSDINVEVLGGMTQVNLQLLDGAYDGPTYTSIFLLSNPNPDDSAVPNSATWDMNFGGGNGGWMDTVETGFVVAGSSGAAYFRMYAWTGLYNTYADAVAHHAYVADSGVFAGATYAGGTMPVPNIATYMPAMVLKAAPTPEPSVLLMVATGLLGLLAYAWRKRR